MKVFTVLFIIVAGVLFLGDHAGGMFAWMLDGIHKVSLEVLKGNLRVTLGVLLLLLCIELIFQALIEILEVTLGALRTTD